MTSTEHVLRGTPFTVRRRVKFGECDPAGVVYTVVFAEYVMSAAELFYEALLGAPPVAARRSLEVGTPSRGLTLDFRRTLRPDEEFDVTVQVGEIRSRSYELHIDAFTPAGEIVFRALLTPICMVTGEARAAEIPRVLRQALESYRADCAAAGASAATTRPEASGDLQQRS